LQRRLAAILAADVVGYSSLMANDEAATLSALKAHRLEVFDPAVARHKGRIVKLMGDGALVEFASVMDAVECALDIQRQQAAQDNSITLRIGINLGDIIIDGDDIYGDGVNVASRLESLAAPGGMCISSIVHESIGNRLEVEFSDAGEHEVKNIDRPIKVFQWPPDGSGPGTRPKQNLALPDKPSIVVLPFDNMSRDPDQDYFADGVVEAITAALANIRSFFVIARNTAFTYKGKSINVRDIGQELGVSYVLEGSVQRAGDRLRITAQLIETENGAHVWAQRFDGKLDDVFELQDQITEQVAGALQPSIRLAEIERVRRKRPQDMGAYDLTMRALPHVWSLEKQETEVALPLLDEALKIDPGYPLALSLAAWCHAQRSVYNWDDDIAGSKAKAVSLAEAAADASRDDPFVLSVLGTVHTITRNYGTARIILERAVSIDPNAAWTWSRLGWLEAYADRLEPALAHFEKSRRLSPFDPLTFNTYVGMASAYQGQEHYDKAVEYFQRALQERPHAFWIYRSLAPVLYGAGRIDEARKAFEVFRQHFPDVTCSKVRDAMVFSKPFMDRMIANLKALGLPD
jgi:adenylate cyclase